MAISSSWLEYAADKPSANRRRPPPLNASQTRLPQTCRFQATHSPRATRAIGLDQCIARLFVTKSVQMRLTSLALINGTSVMRSIAAWHESFISPRIQSSIGREKPVFGRRAIESLSSLTQALRSSAFPPTHSPFFRHPGSPETKSTSGRSRNGTRTSSECLMLLVSVSRRRVSRM